MTLTLRPPALTLAGLTLAGLTLAAALAGSAARAADPEPLATAPAATTGAPPSVAQQIDDYLKTSPAVTLPRDSASGVTSGDEPRRIHGTVDVAVGSGGYRSAFVRSDLPVGKTGTVSIAVGESHFDGARGRFPPGYGAGGRQTLGLDLALGDAALDPRDPRCRRPREDGPDLRDDPRFEGGRRRLCQPAGAPNSPQ